MIDLKKKIEATKEKMESQSNNIEDVTIGHLLKHPKNYSLVKSILKQEYFFSTTNNLIFKAIATLNDQKQAVSDSLIIHLLSYEKNIDLQKIETHLRLCRSIPLIQGDEEFIISHAREVHNIYLKNQKIPELASMIKNIKDDPSLSGSDMVSKIHHEVVEMQSSMPVAHGFIDTKTESKKFLDNMEERSKDPNKNFTPFNTDGFDRYLGGYFPSNLIVIGGFTSVGKTALMLHMMRQVQCPVALLSLEMSAEAIWHRLFAAYSGVFTNAMREERLTPEQISVMRENLYKFDKQIFINDFSGGLKNFDAVSAACVIAAKKGAKVIYIDYLQKIISYGGHDIRTQMTFMTNELQFLAKDLGVTIVVASQLSRAHRVAKRSADLHDFKETGSIENDADVGIIIEEDEESPNRRIVRILKSRSGERNNIIHFDFNGATGIFTEVHEPGRPDHTMTDNPPEGSVHSQQIKKPEPTQPRHIPAHTLRYEKLQRREKAQKEKSEMEKLADDSGF